MPTLQDGWVSRTLMRWWRRLLVAGGVCLLVAGNVGLANAAPIASGAVLLVGSYQGMPGQYSSIQAAVDVARPGDWVLIGPGDYHETGNRVPPGAAGDDRAGAAVLVTTPNIWIRGMDRNAVMLDGTKPGAPLCSSAQADQDFGPLGPGGVPTGRNGLIVFKVSGVSVENISACNFLGGAYSAGNLLWWDGGASTGIQLPGSWRGAFLSGTSSYYSLATASQYAVYAVDSSGPGVFTQVYGNNMADSAFYIGACPNCNAILDNAHGQYNALGYSGTNSGGHLIIQNSEFDHNFVGVSTNSQNNDDQPSPQNGKCPGSQTGPTGTHSCWLLTHSSIHDNNNPNVPTGSGVLGTLPVGTGVSISGGRFDTVADNNIYNNGAWGLLLSPFIDTETPPRIAHCKGGIGLGSFCYFDDWGSEITNNTMSNNGFFGNPSNGDLAEISNLELSANCFHGNVDTSGTAIQAKHLQLGKSGVTSAPPFLQLFPHNICGIPGAGAPIVSILSLQAICNTGFFGLKCPETSYTSYPRQTQVQMMPLPPQPSMPNPCLGVPRNPWCPTNSISQPWYPVPGTPVTLAGQQGAAP